MLLKKRGHVFGWKEKWLERKALSIYNAKRRVVAATLLINWVFWSKQIFFFTLF